MAKSDNTIETITTDPYAFDTRRRGKPLMGCDCMWCFGYCEINVDKMCREIADYGHQEAAKKRGITGTVLDEFR